jgi:hypothetical protein
LVRCHAGCEQEHVIAALQARDLWEDKRRSFAHGGFPAALLGRLQGNDATDQVRGNVTFISKR